MSLFFKFRAKHFWLLITSGQNISHYTTAKLSVHVWNHDLIWWRNRIDTQKHFHKTTITSSWTLSKTKIPIKIGKAQMPSNPNQKSSTRDKNVTRSLAPLWRLVAQHMAKPWESESKECCASCFCRGHLFPKRFLIPVYQYRNLAVMQPHDRFIITKGVSIPGKTVLILKRCPDDMI